MKEIQYLTAYRVLKKIASGGMGSVYLAEQSGSDGFRKIVAIKTIKREYLKNQENIDLFVGEAKLVSDLIHENVLQVYQLGQTKGIYYIVMEYAHGKNLSDFIREHKNRQKVTNVEIGAFIISRVCRSLHYAHMKKDIYGRPLNIVHRDVTPSNVILTYQGVVKLTDFGIAKATTMNTPDEAEELLLSFAQGVSPVTWSSRSSSATSHSGTVACLIDAPASCTLSGSPETSGSRTSYSSRDDGRRARHAAITSTP